MSEPTANDRFYNELTPFHDFAAFVEFDAYEPVPDDWVVMISDVQGSTRAIEEGRYKDVNMVGAASITAVLNICGDIAVPFVFGGDGGTLVVPGSLRGAAAGALAGLRAMSLATFGLALRVGAIPVTDLRARGADLRVRKYELMTDNYLAMFAGGGAELADKLLKGAAPGSPYLLEQEPAGGPNLEGLSCRWEPLVPKAGRMMTIMVQGMSGESAGEGELLGDVVEEISSILGHRLHESAPVVGNSPGEADLLGEVVAKISDILGHRLQESAPASERSMIFRWPPRGLALEARATAGGAGFLWRYVEVLVSSLIQLWCERFDRQAGSYNAPAYRDELRSNTDFRKYDGILRMVLDVSEDQAGLIEAYLAAGHNARRLVYGVHVTDTALMTCLIFSLEQSKHVHFIDGSDGGFAMAAKAFKSRLNKSLSGGGSDS